MTRLLPALLMLLCFVGCARDATKTAVQTSESEYELGRQAFEKQDFKTAEQLFDGAIRRGGLNADLVAEALLMRAKSCIQLGRLDEALHDLEDAGKGPVPRDEVLVAKGEIALKQGDRDRALTLFSKARSLNSAIVMPDTLK